jgi:hypothetical protein
VTSPPCASSWTRVLWPLPACPSMAPMCRWGLRNSWIWALLKQASHQPVRVQEVNATQAAQLLHLRMGSELEGPVPNMPVEMDPEHFTDRPLIGMAR